MHVLDYYFSKKNNYAFSNKNYKLEKLVIKKTLFYDDISTSTLRAMRAQTPLGNRPAKYIKLLKYIIAFHLLHFHKKYCNISICQNLIANK